MAEKTDDNIKKSNAVKSNKGNIRKKNVKIEDKKEIVIKDEVIQTKEEDSKEDNVLVSTNTETVKAKKFVVEKNFRVLDVVIISVIMLFSGLFVGSLFIEEKQQPIYAYDNPLIDELVSTMDLIKNSTMSDITDEQLVNSAIKGMLSSLGDEYADYFETSDADNFEIQMEGEYVGAGCEIAEDIEGNIVVLNVYEDSPASRAGLLYGDIILEVDGTSVVDWTTSDLSSYIRTGGEIGTSISLKVLREGNEVMLSFERGKVVIKSVISELFEQNGKYVGYIKIDVFALNTYSQFKTALQDLEKRGMDSLIIDVRDNSGGYLSVATSIISLFLSSDKVIYQLQDKTSVDKVYSTYNSKRNYKIYVLVNENSASASEILASSLKESYGATIVGKTTYGKGTVQETNKLSDGDMIKYTIQKWLTPNGNWVEGKGYKPDIVIEDESIMLNKSLELITK